MSDRITSKLILNNVSLWRWLSWSNTTNSLLNLHHLFSLEGSPKKLQPTAWWCIYQQTKYSSKSLPLWQKNTTSNNSQIQTTTEHTVRKESLADREGRIATGCCIILQLYIIQSLIPSHEFLVAMTTMSCTHSTQPLSPKKRGQKREPPSMNNGVSIVCSQAMHVHVYERSGSGRAPPHPQWNDTLGGCQSYCASALHSLSGDYSSLTVLLPQFQLFCCFDPKTNPYWRQ